MHILSCTFQRISSVHVSVFIKCDQQVSVLLIGIRNLYFVSWLVPFFYLFHNIDLVFKPNLLSTASARILFKKTLKKKMITNFVSRYRSDKISFNACKEFDIHIDC